MKTRVLVTGADGMLGSNLVRELIKRKHIVRAFVQEGRKVNTIRELNIEMVSGDILKMEDVVCAMQDCDYVIHAAASTSIWPARQRKVYDINLEGTMNIVAAATHQKIKRLVYVGSASTFAAGSKDSPGNETCRFNGDVYGLDYINSKYDAQKVVQKAVYFGLNAVMVHPTFMFGPFDSAPGSGSLILAVYKKNIKVIPPGGKNFICAKDVATATCNALHMGQSGESYILGCQNLFYRDALSTIAKVIHTKAPLVTGPAFLIKWFGWCSSFLASTMSRHPLISFQMASLSCEQQFFSANKAIKELQLPQTPIANGIEEAFNWFKENGYA